jgi:hypothetical protein
MRFRSALRIGGFTVRDSDGTDPSRRRGRARRSGGVAHVGRLDPDRRGRPGSVTLVRQGRLGASAPWSDGGRAWQPIACVWPPSTAPAARAPPRRTSTAALTPSAPCRLGSLMLGVCALTGRRRRSSNSDRKPTAIVYFDIYGGSAGLAADRPSRSGARSSTARAGHAAAGVHTSRRRYAWSRAARCPSAPCLRATTSSGRGPARKRRDRARDAHAEEGREARAARSTVATR